MKEASLDTAKGLRALDTTYYQYDLSSVCDCLSESAGFNTRHIMSTLLHTNVMYIHCVCCVCVVCVCVGA